MTSKDKALAIATEIADQKGMDIQIFDLREVSSFTDFFVIATGTSNRHVRGLADAAVQTAHQHGERKLGLEGDPPGRWILVDLGDVVVHLFETQTREFYSLERLWDEALRLELPETIALEAKAAP